MENPLSFWQRFFKSILSEKAFSALKRESTLWKLQCPNCNYERSLWEMGGIRWKGTGNPRVIIACQNCNQKNWHQLYKKTE